MTNTKIIVNEVLEARLHEVNDLIKNKAAGETVEKALTVLKEDLEVYNRELITGLYDGWLKTDTPLVNALKAFFIEQVSIAPERDADKKITGYIFSKRVTTLSMLDFCEYAPKQIDVNGQWRKDLPVLSYALGLKVLEKLDIDPTVYKSQHIHAKIVARHEGFNFELGISNTKLKKVLQTIADKIVFIPKEKDPTANAIAITSADVNHLILTMVTENKQSLSVRMPRVDTIERLLGKALHRIIAEKGFTADYQQSRKKA